MILIAWLDVVGVLVLVGRCCNDGRSSSSSTSAKRRCHLENERYTRREGEDILVQYTLLILSAVHSCYITGNVRLKWEAMSALENDHF